MFNFFNKNKKSSKDTNKEIAKVNFYRAIKMIKNGDCNGYDILEMSANDGYAEAQYWQGLSDFIRYVSLSTGLHLMEGEIGDV